MKPKLQMILRALVGTAILGGIFFALHRSAQHSDKYMTRKDIDAIMKELIPVPRVPTPHEDWPINM